MARAEKPAYGFDAFFRDLKAGRMYPCYLLTGEEEYVKEQALRTLADRVLSGPMRDMNETRLTDPDADALIAANETLPFMAERRLVVVRECGMLSGKAGDYDEEASAEKLKKYIADLPGSSVLVFMVRGEADRRKKLYKAIAAAENCAVVTFARLSENEQRKWLISACGKQGVTMPADMAVNMIFRTGGGIDTLKTEADKLCAYLGEGGTVDEQALNAIVTQNIAYKVFDLSQAVLEGDGKKAFRMLDGLLYDGEERLHLLALLGYQCRQLLKIALLADRGERDADIASALGIPVFVVSQSRRLAGRFTRTQIARMPAMCEETEFAVKSGAVPDEGSLEKVMLEILSMGEKGGEARKTAVSGRNGK